MRKFKELTNSQLKRLYIRVWHRMTKEDGYQPFGYDSVTLWATKPGFMQILANIESEAKERK